MILTKKVGMLLSVPSEKQAQLRLDTLAIGLKKYSDSKTILVGTKNRRLRRTISGFGWLHVAVIAFKLYHLICLFLLRTLGSKSPDLRPSVAKMHRISTMDV